MQGKVIPLQQSNEKQPAIRRKFNARRLIPFITIAAILAVWQVATMLRWVSPYLIPSPVEVFQKFQEVALQESRVRFWAHVWTTLQEILFGLGIGVLVGFAVGYLIAKVHWLEDLLSPIIVAFQATPIVAYAPLLVIWFGDALTSKVLVVVLIAFFPMLTNTVVGLRSVPPDLRDLMRVLQAGRWQTFLKLEIPAAMPVLIGGLKLSATLAVIGAVVGEFVNADAGLGFLMTDAKNRYDTALVFVAVLTLTTLALTLYNIVGLIERRVLAWRKR